jgi:glucose/arabinose dehydrogenase
MVRRLILAALLMVGCNAQPTQTPSNTLSANQTTSPGSSLAPASTPPVATVSPSPTTSSSQTPTPAETALGPQPSTGCGDMPAFSLVASGFGDLTFVTNAGDGSGLLYVVEQGGRISSLSGCQSGPSGTPWLDISDRVGSGGERGLLGLAFHPEFESNGRFFVDYTDLEGNSVISEFSAASGGTVDSSAERLLLGVDQPFANHNGGMLAFGPDGYLYVGLGDGGSGGDPMGNGQNLGTLLGKILRIDVDSGDPYGIPTDNPFQPGNDQGARPEIWDWGVRNPWRFSFDRESGGLFIGDVGQNQTEEIDVEPAGDGGRNYGWNVMEGDHCYTAATCGQDGLTVPVATYSHDDGCSVTGGYVYRGTRYPSLVGQYFYADLCSGTVWSFDADAALAGEPVTPQVFGHVDFAPSSFGEDESGELYIVDHEGSIYSLGLS